MELRIREFRKGDMDALYFLNQRCHPPERRPRYARILDTLLDRDVAALVAEEVTAELSRLIGGLIVQGDPWNQRLFIVSLLVDADYRRLGIARRLLGWAERLGEGFRCRTLLVPLEAGNADGAAFLAAQGFHESEEAEPFFSGPAQGRLWVREVEAAPEATDSAAETSAGEPPSVGPEAVETPPEEPDRVEAATPAPEGGGAEAATPTPEGGGAEATEAGKAPESGAGAPDGRSGGERGGEGDEPPG